MAKKKHGRGRRATTKRPGRQGPEVVVDTDARKLKRKERAEAIDYLLARFAPAFEALAKSGQTAGSQMLLATGLLGEAKRVTRT